jgi:hypothetical protein
MMEAGAEQAAVEASRRRVEARLEELRGALHDDLGLMPRRTTWVLPAVGLAVGFSLAVRTWRRRRRRAIG